LVLKGITGSICLFLQEFQLVLAHSYSDEFISNIIVKPFAFDDPTFREHAGGSLNCFEFSFYDFIFSEKSIIAGAGVSIFSIASQFSFTFWSCW